ncbi:MAG: lamin tail domain-containing protein [Ferruginibacter sp.]
MRQFFILFFLFSMLGARSQSTTIVISQVYGGGGNTGAPFTTDYVELHNVSGVSQSLSGLSIQYASATSTGVWSGVSALPAVSIPAGGYYLIQMSGVGAVGSSIPTPDYVATPSIAMSGTNGRVALINGTTAVSGCPTGPSIIDLVGYGTSVCFETSATGALSNTTAAIRNNNGCDETNNNSTDFTVATPAPKNSTSPAIVCGSIPVTPTINTTSITAFGIVCVGNTAGPNSFNVSGTNLTAGNIVVGPLSGYAFSLSSTGPYSPSINISQSGGALSTTTVYVQFSPTVVQSYTGAISVSGGGASAVTVSVSGTGSGTLTPAFNAIAPICQGQNFTLPQTSLNGVSGTWSPAVNNTNTTTYTFTPNAGQCAVSTTITVTVNTNVTPTFNQVPPVCNGESFTLPTTSLNGITGTWSPLINNTATTTYTFTPSVGQCALSANMTVDITPSTPTVLTGDSSAITSKSVLLNGEITYGGCTPVTEYGIEYSGINAFPFGTGIRKPSTTLTANAFSAGIEGLVPNTVYYYRAYARNNGGYAYGELKQFITAPIPAGLTIYANPVPRGSSVRYSLSGIRPGHYALRIFNQNGQRVYQQDVITQVDFIDANFRLPATMPMGLYNFEVVQDGFRIRKILMVQ